MSEREPYSDWGLGTLLIGHPDPNDPVHRLATEVIKRRAQDAIPRERVEALVREARDAFHRIEQHDDPDVMATIAMEARAALDNLKGDET
jgi:hypothetical protein